MADYEDELARMFEELEKIPEGPQRIRLLNQAIRMADLHQDVDWGFRLRQDLVHTSFASGVGDQLIVAMSWCLAQADRDADRFDMSTLLWQCKHVLSFVTLFHQISRAQIDAITQDVVRRYEANGLSLRPICMFRASNAIQMGDHDLATQMHQQAWSLPKDFFSEGEEWEVFFLVRYLVEFKRWPEALEAAFPLLEGRLSQSQVSPWIVVLVLSPLVEMGRWNEARALRERSYRLVESNHRLIVSSIAEHIAFLTLDGDLKGAFALFAQHLPWTWQVFTPAGQFGFSLRSWLLFNRLKEAGVDDVPFEFPTGHPLRRLRGRYGIDELAGHYQKQTEDLAAAFNKRNGNDRYTQLIERTRKLSELARPVVDAPTFN